MTKRRGSSKAKGKASKDAIVIKEPRPTDVLFGRGGHINHNVGNQTYLKIVMSRKDEYYNTKKTDKADIAWDIMRQLREQDPCPRFLRKDYSTGLWYVVDDADVRRKISQCLRERGTPVCPKAKRRSKQNKTSMPTLRLPLRSTSTSTTQEETDGESQGKSDSDDDEAWLPSAAMTTRSVSARRATRRGKEPAGRETQATTSLSLVEDMLVDSEKIISEQQLTLPVEDMKLVPVNAVASVGISGPSSVVEGVPPPLPAPKPIRQEGSNRVWSDFLTRSFASFAPSIFELPGGAENAWEDLLDTSLLPDLAPEDDQSHSSGEVEMDMRLGAVEAPKRSLSLSSPQVSVGWIDNMPVSSKRRKTEAIEMLPELGPVPVEFVLSAGQRDVSLGHC